MSQTRRDYRRAYRLLRENNGYSDTDLIYAIDDITVDCALLSYDYHTSEFSGWINHQRQHKFHMIKWHPELREQLPF